MLYFFLSSVLSSIYFYNECPSICTCQEEASWKYYCPFSNNWRSDGFLRCEGFDGPVYYPRDFCKDENMFIQEYATNNIKENYKVFCCELS